VDDRTCSSPIPLRGSNNAADCVNKGFVMRVRGKIIRIAGVQEGRKSSVDLKSQQLQNRRA